jgi:hypothetical protein
MIKSEVRTSVIILAVMTINLIVFALLMVGWKGLQRICNAADYREVSTVNVTNTSINGSFIVNSGKYEIGVAGSVTEITINSMKDIELILNDVHRKLWLIEQWKLKNAK